jgi:hypothetical protein
VDVTEQTKSETRAPKRADRFVPLVVSLGVEGWLPEDLQEDFDVAEADDPTEMLRLLDRPNTAVVILGSALAPEKGKELLQRIIAKVPGKSVLKVVLCAGSAPELFQEFIDEDQIYYLAGNAISEGETTSIARAAVRFRANAGEGVPILEEIVADERLLDFCTRLSLQTDEANATALITETMRAVLEASGSQCLIYRHEEQVLSSVDPATGERRSESVAAGLAGFVARTGDRIELEAATRDPRYDAPTDNPDNRGEVHFLAEPIWGSPGEILGVLTAVRDRSLPSFSRSDLTLLGIIAAYSAPTLKRILLEHRLQSALAGQNRGLRGNIEIFRDEALAHHLRKWDQEGEVLRTVPSWLQKTHWVILAILIMAIAYLSVARVDEYASGPAVVRARSRTNVTASTAGLARSVHVSDGDRVRAGDLLVELQDSSMQVRATGAGVITNVQIRAGQQLSAGQTVATILDEDAGYELIALLPGAYAPRLHAGMPLRLKLDGYSNSNEPLALGRVSAQVVGPHEAARFAGWDAGDAPATGPVVIVEAPLKSQTFQANRDTYAFRDGMAGRAEVSVRSDPIIVSLIPGLKSFLK